MSFNVTSTPTVGLTTASVSGGAYTASGGGRSNYKDIYDLLERLCRSFVGNKDNHSKFNVFKCQNIPTYICL